MRALLLMLCNSKGDNLIRLAASMAIRSCSAGSGLAACYQTCLPTSHRSPLQLPC